MIDMHQEVNNILASTLVPYELVDIIPSNDWRKKTVFSKSEILKSTDSKLIHNKLFRMISQLTSGCIARGIVINKIYACISEDESAVEFTLAACFRS